MKKKLLSLCAIAVCFAVLFSLAMPAASAAQPVNPKVESSALDLGSLGDKASIAQIINKISNFLLNKILLNAISYFMPDNADVTNMKNFDLDEYEDFYAGMETFVDVAQPGAVWSLGYASESILPEDFGKESMKYARGSYVPWWYSTEIYSDEDGVKEDIKVRTIILNDGTGRGSAAFCVIDCIGISNTDIRKVRAKVEKFAKENNIVSINVSATHTHSGIDSQGVWTAPLSTIGSNMFSPNITGGTAKHGVDEDFLATVVDSTAKSIKEAFADLKKGDLYYASADITGYTFDRTPPYCFDPTMYRLEFVPRDASATTTLISNFGCHPESSSYDWVNETEDGTELDTKISADFVYYMEKVANRAGYNFIYIQGDVGTVSSSRGNSNDGLDTDAHGGAMRYGYELGYIALGMTMTQAECEALNTETGDLLGVATYSGGEDYTIWYADWQPVEEVAVEPFLNIKHDQFMMEIENNVAEVLTETGLASNFVIKDYKTETYYTVTELGYMELGNALKVFLCPGETFNELVLGDPALEDFPYECLRDTHGDNLIVFDLQNDAIGYLEPDNYYVMAGYQYDPKNDSLKGDTWCLLVSMGQNAASTIVGKFNDLVATVR